ncbi:MAG: cation-transporting P-type ATPase [Candidatus Rokubacteria bacterium]|nr:cation-transporting P-type ATPase [Candidatus Rokubacteria bacterium]
MSPPSEARRGLSPHALDHAEVVALLGTHAEVGLAPDEARRRLERVGENRVGEHRARPLWRLALDQFQSLVVLLLLAAAVVAWLLGERVEAAAILAALLLGAVIGFVSEWRARVSLARLRALAVPQALCRRGGDVLRVPAAQLVPGDLIVLEAGAQVPADARLVRSSALRVTEAALTGESLPGEKDAAARVAPDTPLGDRRTMVYLGTAVVAGSGLGVVTATGLATELGRIGQLVALAGDRATPLERQVEALGRRLMVLALGICAVVGIAGILHGEPLGLMLETAISLAVAAIPEGLPAVTAVALAAGLWRLAAQGALVRRLPAVETLGSTTVICADKTGTMTENQMSVVRIHLGGRTLAVEADPRSPSGEFREDGLRLDPLAEPDLVTLLTVAALANDAALEWRPEGLRLHGDPTESALLVAALKAGLDPGEIARAWPRRGETPFDPATRLMATFNDTPGGGSALLVKGAPAAVVERSSRWEAAGGSIPLDPAAREALLEANGAFGRDGLRVLAVAWRPEGALPGGPIEELTLLGLVGLADPVRPGVREAIARCAAAGIRTVMLTGDQRVTAEAVGRTLGLAPDAIRSRVSPEEKLALVQRLQGQGEVVAMTGDGVNDAPALARADIGIAMGRRGTDVAREAADLVLTDDNFASVVRAVEEGRVIYTNLRKVIHFLFSCNLSEILIILVGILLGLPAPLLPLQILWVNLVTDILPAVALVRDPPEPDVMRRPPRDPQEALVTWRSGGRMVVEGALLAAGVLSAYLWAVWREGASAHATTIAFVAVVVIHPFQAMNCRSDRVGWWRLPPNWLTWAALGVLLGLQWLAVSWRPLRLVLGAVPLSGADWLTVMGAVVWPVLLLEAVKAWRRSGDGVGCPRPTSSPAGPEAARGMPRNP